MITEKIIAIFLAVVVSASCQQATTSFDAQRAYSFLTKQCDFGPRNPGSPGYVACKDYLIDMMQQLADTVITQPFQYTDMRDHKTHDLTNIIAQFNVDQPNHLLIGAHWDTRPWADWDPYTDLRDQPILGANDGASGVAVLLELAHQFQVKSPPISITLIFLDGEDLGIPGNVNSYAQGSQYFSKHLPVSVPDRAIILDMVGDANLSLPIERNSYQIAPQLVKELWQLAEELKLPAFKSFIDKTIFDDHIPLWEYARIPAIDIIDFDYPYEGENYWHTQDDIPGNCSPESLDQVGTLLIEYIWRQSND